MAWHDLGWTPVAFSEIEKFPAAILAHHYPHVPNLGDMTKIDGVAMRGLGIDLVVGGTPCQAFSCAGLRRSLDDDRGNLTLKFVEICNDIEPRWVVWENVPGVLSTKDNAFGCFLGALAGEGTPLIPAGRRWADAGYVIGPERVVAWRILDAQYFGLAQRRRRVFVVASPRNGGDPGQVLFEPEGMQRNIAPSRETGAGVAGTLEARASTGAHGAASGYPQPAIAIQGNMIGRKDAAGPAGPGYSENVGYTLNARDQHAVAHTLLGKHSSGHDESRETFVARTLRGEGFDASEDGAGRGTPLVPVAVSLRGREGGATAELGGNVCPTIRAGGGGGDKPHVLTACEVADTLAVGANQTTGFPGDICSIGDTAVRRLTPRECERLQGFPDDYTQIPWRNKSPAECPDGPRYRALGNSMAVPVMRWIGKRIACQ